MRVRAVVFVGAKLGAAVIFVGTELGMAVVYVDTELGMAVVYVGKKLGTAVVFVGTKLGTTMVFAGTKLGAAVIFVGTKLGPVVMFVGTKLAKIEEWLKDKGLAGRPISHCGRLRGLYACRPPNASPLHICSHACPSCTSSPHALAASPRRTPIPARPS